MPATYNVIIQMNLEQEIVNMPYILQRLTYIKGMQSTFLEDIKRLHLLGATTDQVDEVLKIFKTEASIEKSQLATTLYDPQTDVNAMQRQEIKARKART